MDKRRFRVTAEQVADLHLMSDRAMQRKYGATQGVWRKARRERGIASFRPATVTNGVPSPWKVCPEKTSSAPVSIRDHWRAPDPVRDHSLAGEAAAYLQRERFSVFNRAKVGMGEGWQVGRSVLSEADMLGKAMRLGFKPQAWMGGL